MIFNLMKPIPIAEPTMYLYGHEADKTVSYNGVVLPELPVWDKASYPYAYIMRYGGVLNDLIISSQPLYYQRKVLSAFTYDYLWCKSESEVLAYQYDATNAEHEPMGWYYQEEKSGTFTADTKVFSSSVGSKPLWANTDLYNYDDNTLYLSASDPVTTYTNADVTINGVGYVGAVLPKLPEWDKTAYPYAFISNEIFDNVTFYALAKEPYNNGIAPNRGTICNPYDERILFVRSYLSDDGDSWGELTASSLSDTGQIAEPFWSNFDVKYEDGSVQLYASEPVPIYE